MDPLVFLCRSDVSDVGCDRHSLLPMGDAFTPRSAGRVFALLLLGTLDRPLDDWS